jgi:hypothetical protein
MIIRLGSGSLVTEIGISSLSGDLPSELFEELHFELAPQVAAVVKKMTWKQAAAGPAITAGLVVCMAFFLVIFEATRSGKSSRNPLMKLIDHVVAFFTAPLGVVGIMAATGILVAAAMAWMCYRIKHRPDVIEVDLTPAM